MKPFEFRSSSLTQIYKTTTSISFHSSTLNSLFQISNFQFY